MSLPGPSEIRRSWKNTEPVRKYRVPINGANPRRRTNHWPGKKLNYEALEQLKEPVCKIAHPTGYYKFSANVEYRLSKMRWSRGAYVDLRQYKKGHPTGVGILLHLDVILALLPDLVTLVRTMESEDFREPEQKAQISVEYF